MKRKLIEVSQDILIQCDNTMCDYHIINETKNPNENIEQYLNKPCPKCGENLLTEEDYLVSMKVLKRINWWNRWFSWIMFFFPKSENVNGKDVSVKCHNGVKINKHSMRE